MDFGWTGLLHWTTIFSEYLMNWYLCICFTGCKSIRRSLHQDQAKELWWKLHGSPLFLEVYNETVTDLLSLERPLVVREGKEFFFLAFTMSFLMNDSEEYQLYFFPFVYCFVDYENLLLEALACNMKTVLFVKFPDSIMKNSWGKKKCINEFQILLLDLPCKVWRKII